MKGQSPGLFQIVKGAFKDFGEDECTTRAAALAYSTIFALPPLLILLITIAGMIWSPAEVQHAIETQFAGMIGDQGARQIHDMVASGRRPGSGGLISTIAGIVGLLIGATGAFMALQGALNRAWEVKPDPEKGGVMKFITKRFLSLGMVLGLGFLLAVSLALTAALNAFGSMLGGSLSEPLLLVLNHVLSFAVLTLLFAAMFKALPDAKIAWRDVWVGGAVTALLFEAGKIVIGLYLGRSNPGSAFGAASALAVILVWIYYAGVIIMLGAEFTQGWAKARGSGIEPDEDAVRVVEREEVVRGAGTKRDGDRVAASTRVAAPASDGNGGGIGKALLGVPVFLLLFGRKQKDKRREIPGATDR